MRNLQSNIQISDGKVILPIKNFRSIINRMESLLRRNNTQKDNTLQKEIESLQEELEDMEDIQTAREARNEPTVKWDDVKRRLNQKHGITE